MIPAKFDYVRPSSVGDAVRALGFVAVVPEPVAPPRPRPQQEGAF